MYYSYFCMKIYVVGTHKKHLTEALLMGTCNVYFLVVIRKISVVFGKKNCLIWSCVLRHKKIVIVIFI